MREYIGLYCMKISGNKTFDKGTQFGRITGVGENPNYPGEECYIVSGSYLTAEQIIIPLSNTNFIYRGQEYNVNDVLNQVPLDDRSGLVKAAKRLVFVSK